MAGILGLNAQEGQMAQSLYDTTATQNARRLASNIETHAQNQAELSSLAGQALSAGVNTAKDYGKFKDTQAAGGDTSKLAGVKDGQFQGVSDFAQNLVNPYARYANLNRALRGQGDPSAVAPQRGSMSVIDSHNAPVTGALITNLLPRFGSTVYNATGDQ